MATAREYLRIVKESALGVPMASPVEGTDALFCRLVDGNSFSMVAAPVVEKIPYGGGYSVVAEDISDHYDVKGSLKTKLYPSQAPLLLALLTERINAGQTSPWTTTEPPGDLASVTIYHAVRNSDGTYRRKRFSGVKAAGGRIEVSRSSTTAMLTLDLLGCRSYGNGMDGTPDPDATEFPLLTDETKYPSAPYTFKNTSGLVTVGTVRTQYESLALAITNALDGRHFEASYLQINQFNGRSATIDVELYLKATPDDRSAYEAIAANAVSIGFNNGVTGQHLTIDFKGQNRISALPYDLPLDKAFMNKLTLDSVYDYSAANDIAVSFS